MHCIPVLVSLAVCGSAALSGPIPLEARGPASNSLGSPSWSAYSAIALWSLEFNTGHIGVRSTDPAAPEFASSHVDAGEFMVTSSTSWRGVAGPTGAFSSELGDRMHSGPHPSGDGVGQFKVADLNYATPSRDPGDDGTDMLTIVPLPTTSALAGLGLFGLGVRRRRASI